jgi:hypothetical protein
MGNTSRRLSVAFLAALALAVFGASPARAQGVGGAPGDVDERHEGIGIGVKGGFLFSNVSVEDFETDSKTGWQVGVFFGGNRPGLVGVMAEVNFGEKGATDPDSEESLNLTFVSVPVVMRINGGARSLNGVNFYGIVGPQFDWLISRKLAQEGFPDEDISEETEGFELNLVFGGGVEITRFIAELRYIQGLKNISKDLVDTNDLKTHAWAILFGFRFN